MKSHGIDSVFERPLYSVVVDDFASLESVVWPSAHIVLLLLTDGRDVSTDVIGQVAERFIAAGVIYVCAWGPDCERVHDIFDEVYVGDGCVERDLMLMTTWHAHDPIEEALWFFLRCAFPADEGLGQTTSGVAITIGNRDWAAAVDEALSDVDGFIRRGLDSEPPVGG